MSSARHLGSTYRLQLHGVGFDGATRLVPYLHDLGIETLYVSPILASVPGNTHGYDVVDPTRLNPELGTAQMFDDLLSELATHSMGLLIDIVPNHMAAAQENPWWWDVLKMGQASPFANYFDIDWEGGAGRVVLPVLGRPLAQVIARGELTVSKEAGERVLCYFDHRFPLSHTAGEAPRSLLYPDSDRLTGSHHNEHLWTLLNAQHYRLAYWRIDRHECNYRRFFDIDTLVGMKVENKEVYEDAHRFILELVSDERVNGVRVNHIDGLADPRSYLATLRNDMDKLRKSSGVILVEKILSSSEDLPIGWESDGTTGYEFVDLAIGLLVYPTPDESAWHGPSFTNVAVDSKRMVLRELFAVALDRIVRMATRVVSTEPGTDIADADMRNAIGELTAQLDVYRTYIDSSQLSATDKVRIQAALRRSSEELSSDGLRALEAFTSGVLNERPEERGTSLGELTWLDVAQHWQQMTVSIAAKGVEDTALYRFSGCFAGADVGCDPERPKVTVNVFHDAMKERIRSTPLSLNATSTHDTKRGEDVRARLAVLSEVPGLWHQKVEIWRDRHPQVGEALRHRASCHRTSWGDQELIFQSILGIWRPGSALDPTTMQRISEYMIKAAREAKVFTSWRDPNTQYEQSLTAFIEQLLADPKFQEDMDALVAQVGVNGAVNSLALCALKCTAPGVPDIYQGSELWEPTLVDPDNRQPVDFEHRIQLLQSHGHPGSKDSSHTTGSMIQLIDTWWDGRAKMITINELLTFRRHHPDLFDKGDYLALRVEGEWRDHVVAFARRNSDLWVITIIPVLTVAVAGLGCVPIGDVWLDTAVEFPQDSPDHFFNLITSKQQRFDPQRWLEQPRKVLVSSLLFESPVAVLASPATPNE